MKIVIDTSSLISLVRYYLPFDVNFILFNFIKKKIEIEEIIILDKVFEECKYTAKDIVVKKLTFISERIKKTSNIFPNKKFFNLVENQFCYKSMKNKLSEIEFEKIKENYLKSADFSIILYGNEASSLNSFEFERPIIVTEETETKNDNKVFKKIPEICKMLGIKAITLPELFNVYCKEKKLNIQFKTYSE